MSQSYRDYGFVGFDDAVVVDVETTGLDPELDRIICITCLKGSIAEFAKEGRTHLEYFKARLNPGIPIPYEASRVHGIKDDDVRGEERFADIAAQLRAFIGPLPLIGHNITFDKAFLSAEFKRSGQKSLHRNRSYCTMKRLREHFGYSGEAWQNISLEQAASHFGLKGRTEAHHDATEDAMLALQLAGGLYQLDNGLLPARRKHRQIESEVAPSSGKIVAGRNLVLTSIIAIVILVFALLLLQ